MCAINVESEKESTQRQSDRKRERQKRRWHTQTQTQAQKNAKVDRDSERHHIIYLNEGEKKRCIQQQVQGTRKGREERVTAPAQLKA